MVFFNLDPNILAEVTEMSKELEAEKQKVVGYSAVYLEGDSKVCRLMECNLGNSKKPVLGKRTFASAHQNIVML